MKGMTMHTITSAAGRVASAPAGLVPQPPTEPMIDARDLTRVWGSGAAAQTAVDGVDLKLGSGELVAIVAVSCLTEDCLPQRRSYSVRSKHG
jgi:hypothetical protein